MLQKHPSKQASCTDSQLHDFVLSKGLASTPDLCKEEFLQDGSVFRQQKYVQEQVYGAEGRRKTNLRNTNRHQQEFSQHGIVQEGVLQIEPIVTSS